MALVGFQPGRDATVAVVLHRHADAQPLAGGRGAAFGQHQQAGVDVVLRDPGDMRCKAHRRRQAALEFGGVDDPGQLLDALRPGRKIQRRACASPSMRMSCTGVRASVGNASHTLSSVSRRTDTALSA
jgi:hypothetical protein